MIGVEGGWASGFERLSLTPTTPHPATLHPAPPTPAPAPGPPRKGEGGRKRLAVASLPPSPLAGEGRGGGYARQPVESAANPFASRPPID